MSSSSGTPATDPYAMLADIERRWPARLAGSDAEREAQEHLGEALAALGASLERHHFTWPPHLYGALAVNFGVGVAATFIGRKRPLLGAALHALAAYSAWSELTRRGLVLRRLWPAVASQNVIATFRAPGDTGPVKRRLVLLAHADSAYTGLIFHPDVIRNVVGFPTEGKNHGKQMVLPLVSMIGLAALGALRAVGAAPRWEGIATALLTVPPAIVTAANLDVVARNHVVPGAADNLSGCVAGVELARRLAPRLQVGTELCVVITGCEEAGTGGADRLAQERDRDGMWPKDTTTILAIDTLANGDLFLLEEGELSRAPVPERLARAVAETSAEPGMVKVDTYVVPTGATDCYPFLRRGWDACALTSIDRTIGAPRHYHRPSDTAANLSPEELARSIDFAERLCLRLLAG